MADLYISYLLFMNPLIGLHHDYKTPHCKAFYSASLIRPCNRVLHTEIPIDAEIEEIKTFFGDTPFSWAVHETDVQTISRLENHNLSYKVRAPLMFKELGNIQPKEQHADITVQKLDTATFDMLLEWIRIMSRACSADSRECAKILNTFLRRTNPGTMVLYLGLYQGVPAAVGMVLYHNTVAALHWIGTVPEYRRKGLARAITNHILIDSQQAGCTTAILLSSDMGKALYDDLEFTPYATYRMYGNY